MPSLDIVRASNALIKTALPSGMVAVFAGSTSGIGEYAMVQFAKHADKPRIYFIGRSQEAADRLIAQMKASNPDGTYTFLKKDMSLLRNVDSVCEEIKSKESTINLLHITQGSLHFQAKTDEGLRMVIALVIYSRNRLVQNLLPLVQAASSLRRVVSVFAGTKEGKVNYNDIGVESMGPSFRGHTASLITFSLEALAKKAPEVSFIHDFPGHVRNNLIREDSGALLQVLKFVGKIMGSLGTYIPDEDSGDRHVYLATSAAFPPALNSEKASGVALEAGQLAVKGTAGEAGSGVYTVDENCEPPSPATVKLYGEIRESGAVDKIWANQEEVYARIAGKARA